MRRGLSKAYINRSVVSRARKLVLSDVIVCPSSEPEDQSLHVAETPVFTFVLPNINIYPDGFKAFLYKELIESPTLVSLEQGGKSFDVDIVAFMPGRLSVSCISNIRYVLLLLLCSA